MYTAREPYSTFVVGQRIREVLPQAKFKLSCKHREEQCKARCEERAEYTGGSKGYWTKAMSSTSAVQYNGRHHPCAALSDTTNRTVHTTMQQQFSGLVNCNMLTCTPTSNPDFRIIPSSINFHVFAGAAGTGLRFAAASPQSTPVQSCLGVGFSCMHAFWRNASINVAVI